MFKEKSTWLYIGKDLENSFQFFLSKIKDSDAIIVIDKDTEDMNVFKVKLSELEENKSRLKEVKG